MKQEFIYNENGANKSHNNVNKFLRCAPCRMGFFINVFMRRGLIVCPHCQAQSDYADYS
jgi:hypothetical protein